MASTSISGWNGAGNRTMTLDVSTSNLTNNVQTRVTMTVTISGGDYNYYDSHLKVQEYDVDNNRWWPIFDESAGAGNAWYTIKGRSGSWTDDWTRTKVTRNVRVYITGYAYTYSDKTSYVSITIPPKPSYAVTYNANGGSGAPAGQTKWYDENLTLQSGIPTRSGYDFLGWATSSGGSVVYAAGATYTGNAALTLYAVWTPKYSSITSVTDTVLGNAPAVKWTPIDSSFTFKVTYSIGSWSWTSAMISPGSTSEQTFDSYTLAVADIAPYITTAKTGTMTCKLETFMGDGTLNGSSTKNFTVTVPSTVVPSIDSITLAEGEQSGFGVYVKTLSSVEATVAASGIYGSTIALITMTVEGALYTAQNGVAESVIFNTSGSLPVVITVTDSRGYQATETRNITVYDYFSPSATMDVDVYENTIKVTVSGEIASVNNLNQKRLVITRVRLSDQATQTYTINPLSSYSFTQTWNQTLADASTSTYEFTAVVYDTINSTTMVERTGIVTLSLLGGGGGAALFGRATEAGFWIYDTAGEVIRHDITSAEYLELANLLAEAYSVTKSYFVGEFCIYNGYVWECKTAIGSGGEAWNANHWIQLGVAS